MERYTLEEILEWVVLGLLVAVLALVAFWLGGWLFVFLGKVFLAVSKLIVALLYFLVPALLVAGIVYLLVQWISRRRPRAEG